MALCVLAAATSADARWVMDGKHGWKWNAAATKQKKWVPTTAGGSSDGGNFEDPGAAQPAKTTTPAARGAARPAPAVARERVKLAKKMRADARPATVRLR